MTPPMPDLLIADTARFVHDTIDGETLLLDNETGHLLLIGGFGASLWPRLVEGAAVEPLLADVAARFGPAAGEACRALLATLAEAGVVVPADAANTGESAFAWPESFEAPVFERYDDIANIIAMDPIHEVDESTGWPKPRAVGRE
jgi:hypothetical protein